MEESRSQEYEPTPGGYREMMRLALPLIISSGFTTLQLVIDRIMLSKYSGNAVAASMPAAMLFWTPFALLQNTSIYVTTFVAQYLGAGRPRRVGPAVWQGLYFSVLAGVGFLAFLPLAEPMVAWGDHSPDVQELEATYFRCLCFAALPMLLVACVSGFFSGRGDTWTVAVINAVGMLVNGVLDYAWIYGYWGFPEWGMAGAGWATVVGSWTSAILGLALLFRPKYRAEFATLSGWRFEGELFRRLMRFGFPSGMQWALDALAFTLFLVLIGRLGDAELGATTLAVTLNLLAFLPTMGIGQAVMVLVGQRLGQDRPDLAERATWTGFKLAWGFMTAVALLYVLTPGLLLELFHNADPQPHTSGFQWDQVATIVPLLLRFVAVYCLFDSVNLVFSFALRGAGDTRFVTAVALALSWPMMVIPTWACWKFGWGIYWAWASASAYIIALAFIFLFRFRQGKWKAMRVIEAAPPTPEPSEIEAAPVVPATEVVS